MISGLNLNPCTPMHRGQGHMGRGQKLHVSRSKVTGSRSAKHSRYWQVGSHQHQDASL